MGGTYEHQFCRGDFRNALAYQAKFTGIKFQETPWSGANLSGSTFLDCTFEKCDLRLANLNATTFRNCRFTECLLDQATFHSASLKGVEIEGGRAQYASFWNASVSEVKLDTNLHGADLRYAASNNLDYGEANPWGCQVSLNCANFKDVKISERNLELLLALVCQTAGNDGLRNQVLSLISTKSVTLMHKLARADEA